MPVACGLLKVQHASFAWEYDTSRVKVCLYCFHGDARVISVCLQKPRCVSAWLLPAAAREKPELTLPYQGSSLLLIDQSISV